MIKPITITLSPITQIGLKRFLKPNETTENFVLNLLQSLTTDPEIYSLNIKEILKSKENLLQEHKAILTELQKILNATTTSLDSTKTINHYLTNKLNGS